MRPNFSSIPAPTKRVERTDRDPVIGADDRVTGRSPLIKQDLDGVDPCRGHSH